MESLLSLLVIPASIPDNSWSQTLGGHRGFSETPLQTPAGSVMPPADSPERAWPAAPSGHG